MVNLAQNMNLLSVLDELLRQFGETRVNFEVTDATRSILSLKKCADSGAMTIFKPYGGGRIIEDKEAIQNSRDFLESTQGFDIVHENGAYALKSKDN